MHPEQSCDPRPYCESKTNASNRTKLIPVDVQIIIANLKLNFIDAVSCNLWSCKHSHVAKAPPLLVERSILKADMSKQGLRKQLTQCKTSIFKSLWTGTARHPFSQNQISLLEYQKPQTCTPVYSKINSHKTVGGLLLNHGFI